MDLDSYVQLHEHIEIHYYVDHYAAEFHIQDGQRRVAVGQGATISEALANLEATLGTKTLDEWRTSK